MTQIKRRRKNGQTTIQESDMETAMFVFCYFKFHGKMPRFQEVGDQFGFTRQAAYDRISRLVRLNVIRKKARGKYEPFNPLTMTHLFQEIYSRASAAEYKRLYKRSKKK